MNKIRFIARKTDSLNGVGPKSIIDTIFFTQIFLWRTLWIKTKRAFFYFRTNGIILF